MSPSALSLPDTGPDYAGAYRRLTRRRVVLLVAAAGATLLSLLLDLSTGPAGLGLGSILDGLLEPDSLSRTEQVILWNLRLPQALLALTAGACLGLAGAETQTALNNPLASPHTLGITFAAILGATLAIVFKVSLPLVPPILTLPAIAFLFAAGAGLLVLALSIRFGSNTETVILFGIALLFTCAALVELLRFVADAEDVQQSVLWSMGTLNRATWPAVAVVAGALAVGALFALRGAWSMTLLRSGDEQARSAGLSVHRLRLGALLRTSLLAGTAVSFVGAIGFIGLVAPHIARMALGEDHRFYLPGAMVAGGLLLSLASVFAKVIVPGVLVPVGIVTALIGIPAFLALVTIRRMRR